MSPVILAVIVFSLLFAFLNGVIDSSSIVATMISSRASSTRVALGMTAFAEFLGPFILGTAVARTIGRNIVNPLDINPHVILAAILSAVLWNLVTSLLGIPSSSSHALVGGLVGAALISAGMQAIQGPGLVKVVAFLFISPLVGFMVGYGFLNVLFAFFHDQSPIINNVFKRFQIPIVFILGLSHGSNDAPKTMGMITIALLSAHYIDRFSVPLWVLFISSLAISLGTAIGGQRLIRTVGGKFYKIRPLDALSTQVASAAVLFTGSILGGPMSASHVISSAIMGVGAAERISKVHWIIAQNIIIAWLVTIPASALLSAGLYKLLSIFI